MDERPLTKGERVVKPGFKFKNEPDRYGEVVECYEGMPSAGGSRVHLLAVKFDDTGKIERGFIQGGQLRRDAIMCTRMLGI